MATASHSGSVTGRAMTTPALRTPAYQAYMRRTRFASSHRRREIGRPRTTFWDAGVMNPSNTTARQTYNVLIIFLNPYRAITAHTVTLIADPQTGASSFG
jgi:hypothetical protein